MDISLSTAEHQHAKALLWLIQTLEEHARMETRETFLNLKDAFGIYKSAWEDLAEAKSESEE